MIGRLDHIQKTLPNSCYVAQSCVTSGDGGDASTPCRLKSGAVATFDGSKVMTVDLSTLDVAVGAITDFTVRVGKQGGSASTHVALSISGTKVADVSVSVFPQFEHIPKTGGELAVDVQSGEFGMFAGGAETCEWSISPAVSGGAGGDGTATGMASCEILIDFVGGSFVAGTPYVVTLRGRVSGGAAEGVASITVRGPLPPWGGSLAVSPETGEELMTSFTLECTGWDAENLPISYQFAVVPAGQTPGDGDWSPAVTLEKTELSMMAGSYVAQAKISDSLKVSALSELKSLTVAQMTIPSIATGSSAGAGGDEQTIRENALADAAESSLDSLESLGRVTEMFAQVDAMIKALLGDTRRRASSAAYRLRMRRMLLNKMAGGPSKTASPNSAAQLSSTASTLTKQPDQLDLSASQSGSTMLNSSASMLSGAALSAGAMETCFSATDNLFKAVRPMRQDLADMVTGTALNVLLQNAQKYADFLLESEGVKSTQVQRLDTMYRAHEPCTVKSRVWPPYPAFDHRVETCDKCMHSISDLVPVCGAGHTCYDGEQGASIWSPFHSDT